MREEINKLEIEVRKLRDEEADRLTENKNLEYLFHQESRLAEEKAKLEERALFMLSNDLEEQLNALESSDKVQGGKVTPFKMQKDLKAKYNETMVDYEQFIEESEQDLVQTMAELALLNEELAKE